ncbi:MAG: VOC family protein [Pseudomonadota bacterium]
MATLREIVIDSVVPSRLAKFWEAALDEYSIRDYDEAEIARLADLGLTPETDPAVALDGPGPTIFFQLSQFPKTQRNRMHFDICGGNRIEQVQRLEALGATIRDVHETYTVMLDPEGNEFCVTDP